MKPTSTLPTITVRLARIAIERLAYSHWRFAHQSYVQPKASRAKQSLSHNFNFPGCVAASRHSGLGTARRVRKEMPVYADESGRIRPSFSQTKDLPQRSFEADALCWSLRRRAISASSMRAALQLREFPVRQQASTNRRPNPAARNAVYRLSSLLAT